MEQSRHLGEALGSLKALMEFKDNIQVNQQQCCFLFDMFSFAYDSVAKEMRRNLRFEEKQTKWRILEQPLREIRRVFKEGEDYIRHCLEIKEWWAKAITLYQNKDCTDFHIHNLVCSIFVVIEAVETAAEMSSWDPDETQQRRLVFSAKYKKEHKDLKFFQWKFGEQYLITQDFCNRFGNVWKEDRWILLSKIHEKKASVSSKDEERLLDLLFKNLDRSETLNGKLLPSSILLRSKDYQLRRRLGIGSQHKEIQWLGESFAMRHFFGDIDLLMPEISALLSLSHPNIMYFLCGFTDDDKKECFLITDLMSKDLATQIKELSRARKRIPFSLSVAVDLMLQIARGMEYLHSRNIYHGDLNPSNILVNPKGPSPEGHLHAKVSGFGLNSVRNTPQKVSSNQNGGLPFIWNAPEVLEEQERIGRAETSKYTVKSDVYSFGMVSFEIITGKVPFEDAHLHGDKMTRNIRAGERPLFPFGLPRYVTNLTKKCWHSDPNQRPGFSSICRILRYTKRFLAMNPDINNQTDLPIPMPMVDYWELESGLLREFPLWGSSDPPPLSQIPFQMFVYRVAEREKSGIHQKDNSESGSEDASAYGDESVTSTEDFIPTITLRRSLTSPDCTNTRRLSLSKKSPDMKVNRLPVTRRGRSDRPPTMASCGRSMRLNSESNLMSPRIRRTSSCHASDSELS